jgi:hypothetical protein
MVGIKLGEMMAAARAEEPKRRNLMTELPEDPASFAANLAQAQAKVGQDPIWFWRGHAINAYAVLEASLCALLSVVGEMREDVAGVIFYKITSADSRNKILEQLI